MSDIENFAVQIPKPTYSIPKLLLGAHLSQATFSIAVTSGDWVKKGQPIARIAAEIIAPCDGQVQFVGTTEPVNNWSLSDAWPERYNNYFIGNLGNNVLLTIVPLQGQGRTVSISYAYQNLIGEARQQLEAIQRMSERKVKKIYGVGSKEDIDGLVERVREQIAMLERSKPKFNTADEIDMNSSEPEPQTPFMPTL